MEFYLIFDSKLMVIFVLCSRRTLHQHHFVLLRSLVGFPGELVEVLDLVLVIPMVGHDDVVDDLQADELARDEALAWIIARVEAFNVTITKPAERRRGPARPGSAKIIAQDAATAFGRREQQS